MCGRYTLYSDSDNLADKYNLATTKTTIKPNYNVAPGQLMPVITSDGKSNNLEIMKWGLIPFWAKKPSIGYKLINARSESIFEKPMWKNLITKKRCIIPANGFYEWQKVGDNKEQKQPFYISPKQDTMFSFAGVWESFKDVENNIINSYSIITTSPNKEMSAIHDRMPVILNQTDLSEWLEPSLSDPVKIMHFLRPQKDDSLKIYEVSKDVNSPRHNSKELIYELGK